MKNADKTATEKFRLEISREKKGAIGLLDINSMKTVLQLIL